MLASIQSNDSVANVKTAPTRPELLEAACAELKSSGLRITRPRLAILEALIARSEPASIEQIHEGLESSRCDLVTVYRCISAFEDISLVRRAFFLNGTCRYALNLGRPARYHVVCKQTRRIDEIDAASAAELSRALLQVEQRLRAMGYADVGHMVEFMGTAPGRG
jgi:Fur family ferric uptake transcriptional regulator